MLDFADFVAINKFDRKGAEDALRDVRKQVQRNREAFQAAPGRDAGLRHDREPLLGRRRDRALPGARREADRQGPRAQARQAAAGRGARLVARRRGGAAEAQPLPGRDRRMPARLSRARAGAGAPRARAPEPDHREGAADEGGHGCARAERADRGKSDALDARSKKLLEQLAGDRQGLRRRRVRREDPRPRDPHEPAHGLALGHQAAEGRAAEVRGPGRDPQVAAARERAGRVSRTPRACSPSSARTRIRRACSRARAMPSAPTSASTCCPRTCRPSACRPRSTR